MDVCNSAICSLACASRGPALVRLTTLRSTFSSFRYSAGLNFSVVLCSFPTRVMSDERDWDQFQDWTQELSEVVTRTGPSDC